MALDTKTQDELEAIVRGALRGHVPGADVAPGSDYDVTARMAATAARLGQSQAEYISRQIFAADAEGEFLERHAAKKNITRQLAAKAIGKVQIVSSGVTPQPAASALTHDDTTAFVTTTAVVPTLPAVTGLTVAYGSTEGRLIVDPATTGMAADQVYSIGGHQRAIREVIGGSTDAVDLYEPLPAVPAPGTAITALTGGVAEIEAVEVGSLGNKLVGDVLELTVPVTGVTPEVRILELSGGGDDETDDELRSRVVDAEAERPGGGNREHIRTLARETEDIRIADAVVFPGLRGLGTVDIIPMGVSGARRVGALVAALIQAEVETELADALDVLVSPLEYDSTSVEVDATVTTGIGYEADWSGGPLVISATPASTTSRIYLTATAVGVVAIGDRCLVPLFGAGGWRTYEVEVTAVDGSGADDWIDVALVDGGAALPIAPASADPGVFPSGPLAQEVLAAFETYFAGLGPSAKVPSLALVYERHPDPSIAWDDTVRLGAMGGAIDAIPGVIDVAFTLPAANVRPAALQVARLGKLIIRFAEA